MISSNSWHDFLLLLLPLFYFPFGPQIIVAILAHMANFLWHNLFYKNIIDDILDSKLGLLYENCKV